MTLKSMKATHMKASAVHATPAMKVKTEKFAAMTNKFNQFSAGVNAKP